MRYLVESSEAPKAIGPYSQGIKANGFVFVSGQVALDPKTGAMVGSDVAAQTDRVLQNLRAIVEAAGSDLDRVVKTTVYLRSMADFAAMNEVYAKYFKGEPPARATVAVAGLPKDALVEIDVIAEA
ncbi:MAG: RidA family protein [Terriglobales bacterium]